MSAGLPQGTSPLRFRDFRLMWGGFFVSQVGTQMQVVAVSWQVYQLTGDPLALGAIGLARVLPVILFGVFGGVFADVVDRRLLLLGTQSAMMLCSLLRPSIAMSFFVSPRAGARRSMRRAISP